MHLLVLMLRNYYYMDDIIYIDDLLIISNDINIGYDMKLNRFNTIKNINN